MALIKCPECGRENVSDTAEACPNCGYGIKAHYDKIKKEKRRREQLKRAEEERKIREEEEKKLKEERIKNVPELEFPRLVAPIVTLMIAICIMSMAYPDLSTTIEEVEESMARGYGDPHLTGGIFMFVGVVVVIVAIYLFYDRIKEYRLSKTNFTEYQKQVIREEDVRIAFEKQREFKSQYQSTQTVCPKCGSTSFTPVRRKWSLLTGFMTNKVDMVCNNCGYTVKKG